ncbi:MAG: hypothetical protein ACPLKP_00290 [Microgenomates group bacterium]
MLVVTHSLVGGLVASKISNPPLNPWLTSPLLFIFHFFLDWIPHWDLGIGFKKRSKIINFLLGGFDLAVALIICWFIFQKNLPLNPWLWLGIFFSILPDLLEFPVLFLNWRIFPFSQIEILHSHYFHRKAKFLVGILPQIVIILLVLLLK